MERFGGFKFETRPIIEQKPFENPAVRGFFQEWCKVNDSIELQIISREDWEKKEKEGIILEKKQDGRGTLFVPEDLQLWEMIGIMEAVDADTFAEKPEYRSAARERILRLGETFKNVGAYIGQRLEGIKEGEGREIAQALALEFYEYGQALTQSKRPEKSPDINDLLQHKITQKETREIDRFLAGENLYESRRKRVSAKLRAERLTSDTEKKQRKKELLEIERQKTLSQFFKTAQKAFELRNKSREEEKSPLLRGESPIHTAFLKRIEEALTREIGKPKYEFAMAIFRRGLEKLVNEIRERGWKDAINHLFEKLGLNLGLQERKLVEALEIPKLKTELEEIRKKGNPTEIAAKEREIADKIQKAVSDFPYRSLGHNPSEIIAKKYLNCLGASLLGSALMEKVGLCYLTCYVSPRSGSIRESHSVLLLITSDGKIEWRDMVSPSLNANLSAYKTPFSLPSYDPREQGVKIIQKWGKERVTTEDIIEFSKKPHPEGLTFLVRHEKLMRSFLVNVSTPENGHLIQLLNNTAAVLSSFKRFEEAIAAHELILMSNPKFFPAYFQLTYLFITAGRPEKALETARKCLEIKPSFESNLALGLALSALGRYEEALQAYQEAYELSEGDFNFPKRFLAYWFIGDTLFGLKDYERALENYEEAISEYSSISRFIPEFPHLYYSLGRVLTELGRLEEARKAYENFIKLASKKRHRDAIRPDKIVDAKKRIEELKTKS
jgi:tetratricopeptide (TPR) repeat protein